jgi:serine/threonine protein kinase
MNTIDSDTIKQQDADNVNRPRPPIPDSLSSRAIPKHVPTTTQIMMTKQTSTLLLVQDDEREFVVKNYSHLTRSSAIEMGIMSHCDHDNLISVEKITINEIDTSAYKRGYNIWMNREDMPVSELITDSDMTDRRRINILLQIAYGLRYLHAVGFVHLDLKPDNVMITDGVCKIIDFGSGEKLCPSTNTVVVRGIKCTSTHRAPEGFDKNSLIDEYQDNTYIFTTKFDVWSLGMIALELFSGYPIHIHPSFPVYISNKNQQYEEELEEFITSAEMSDLVKKTLPEPLRKCLTTDVASRLTVDELIESLTKIDDSNYIYDTRLPSITNPIESASDRHLSLAIIYCRRIASMVAKFKMFAFNQQHIFDHAERIIHRVSGLLPVITQVHVEEMILIAHFFAEEKDYYFLMVYFNNSLATKPKERSMCRKQIVRALDGKIYF